MTPPRGERPEPGRGWRYPGHACGDDGAAARQLAAALDPPLQLHPLRHRWDPADTWTGDVAELLPDVLFPVIAAGPRDAFEFEMVLVGSNEEPVVDHIIDAGDLARAGERAAARRLLRRLIERDGRCIDAHGHLGWLFFEHSAKRALPHYLAGVAIGERSLPEGFGDALPWGFIDNRPFLRCLHGLALCRWRMGDFAEAQAILTSLMWLNPDDNQGIRDIIEPVAQRLPWLPHDTFA